mgnify:CR=1 FL=1
MIYTAHYKSPIGEILLASDGYSLIGLWLENQKYFLATIKEETIDKPDLEVFIQTQLWLDNYFDRRKPSIKEQQIDEVKQYIEELRNGNPKMADIMSNPIWTSYYIWTDCKENSRTSS